MCRAGCAILHRKRLPRDRARAVDILDDAVGTLHAGLWRTAEERKRLDEGPSGFVNAAMKSGELQSCTVTTAWSNLLGRPMTAEELLVVLPALVTGFEAQGHKYRQLIKTIVTSSSYRRLD